jgi:hypothetical protein
MPTDIELTWSKDIEDALERLRILCLVRSKYHKNNYFKMLNRLKYFRIPIIILSGLNSVFNVALTEFLTTTQISLLCCFISLTAGLIGSIELFLQIQKNMEVDLLNAKEFYLNSIDIDKTLKLEPINRTRDGNSYLEEKFSNYSKLVESSVIVDKATHDNIISLSLIENLTDEEKIQIINKNTAVETILLLRQEKQENHSIFENIPFFHKYNRIEHSHENGNHEHDHDHVINPVEEKQNEINLIIKNKPNIQKLNVKTKMNSSDNLFKNIDHEMSSIHIKNLNLENIQFDLSFNLI